MAEPAVEGGISGLGDVETRRGLYKAMATSFEAVLAAMPHIGCKECRVEEHDVPDCPCDCHVDYLVEGDAK